MRRESCEILVPGPAQQTREAALAWLEGESGKNFVPGPIPGFLVTADNLDAPLPLEMVTEIQPSSSVYGKSVLPLGDVFYPLVELEATVITTELDSAEEVRAALEALPVNEDDDTLNDAIADLAAKLTTDGKSAAEAIAGDETDNLSEIAKQVLAAADKLNAPDAAGTPETPACAGE